MAKAGNFSNVVITALKHGAKRLKTDSNPPTKIADRNLRHPLLPISINNSYICFMQNELKNKEQIFRILQSNNQQIRNFGVKKIGLFGSFAKNQQTADSDIDFIVEFEKEKKRIKVLSTLRFFWRNCWEEK